YADGIPELFSTHVALQALKNVGFEIEYAQDIAINDDPIPWYYPLEGDLRGAQTLGDYFTVFRMTRLGRFCTRALKLGIAPAGSLQTQSVLETAGDCIVEGGRLGIFTPMYLLVATVLNRELFRRTVEVIGVRVPTNSVAKFLKVIYARFSEFLLIFNEYRDLFNQPKLKNVVNDPESSNTKIILLNPNVENDIIKAILPSGVESPTSFTQ
ncbi:20161_t:CDS:2, partial [Racocetra fulgida]